MGKAVWLSMISLDGFEADRNDNIDFHVPSDEVHRYINALNENSAVMLLDRNGYDIMKYWDDPAPDDLRDEAVRVYAEQWKHIKKIVVADDIDFKKKNNYALWNQMTEERIDGLLAKTPGYVLVGSSLLAWELLKLNKLSDIQIITVPILLGDGARNFADSGEIPLKLVDYKIFENGWAYMHYQVIRLFR